MNKKFVFSFTATLFIISLFAVISFEAFHTGHESHCQKDDCPICIVLQIIHTTQKISSKTAATAAEFISILYINVLILSAFHLAPVTLVKQKVKLVI